jgi:hypothetical protein
MANEFVARNGLIAKNDSYITGSLFVTGSVIVTGSVTFDQGVTSSLFGTASWALNVVNGGTSNLLAYQISSGSVSASVNVGGSGIFLIKSASNAFLEISASSETSLYSNIFIVKNYTSKKPSFIVSESTVRIVTQSFDITQATHGGEIRFTPTALYISLD